MMKRAWVAAGLLVGLVACANGPAILSAIGTNTFDEIRSEDGSLRIRPGEAVALPEGINCFSESIGIKSVFGEAGDYANGGRSLTNPAHGPQAVSKGAIPVSVKRGDEQYFGALMLCKPIRWCDGGQLTGPASKSFAINIPAATYANARGGKIATSYETVTVQGCRGGALESVAWVMWLSDRKF